MREQGLERLEGEDLDFEERNEYQDDEEGFQLGIEEEQEAKELEVGGVVPLQRNCYSDTEHAAYLQAKNKVEFDRANRNVGVLSQNRGSDSDEDDLFGDKEDEETKKKVKKLLKKRMGEDDDSSSDEYADSVSETFHGIGQCRLTLESTYRRTRRAAVVMSRARRPLQPRVTVRSSQLRGHLVATLDGHRVRRLFVAPA
jgi:hypothetical protein